MPNVPFPAVSLDQEYIAALRKNPPKTIGAAMDIIADIRREITTHRASPFFASLSKEVGRTYEELTTRKEKTEEAVKRLLEMSEKIAAWKIEEEIGRDRYPLYEVIKSILPNVEKQRITNFIDELIAHLKEKRLIFEGWQMQRDVRRSIRAEIRLMLLSRFRNHRSKMDELAEGIFAAMEGLK